MGHSVPLHLGNSVLHALGGETPRVRLRASIPAGTAVEEATGTRPFDPTQRYRISGEIARGGMGAVLKGFDADLGRDIALKVLLESHHGKSDHLHRFIEEAQISGQLQHPGVVPIYELGQFPDHRPYFTMKLVHGQTMSALLQERPSPQADRPHFLKVFEQVCQTLAYAHSRGVIHRDLKPGNIMVGAFGEVQVMDWGLAKVLGHRTSDSETREASAPPLGPLATGLPHQQTRTGAVMGTPAYMPPEQAKGETARLDERCDVFGLGAILCEILTGQPPYVAPDLLGTYDKAVRGDLTDAHTRLEHCGAEADLIQLAKKCLTVSLEERPRHAGIVAQELSAYLNSVEQRLRQAETQAAVAQTKAQEERKRRRVTFRLAAGILLTLTAGLTVSLWQMNVALAAEERAKINEKKAVELAAAEKQARQAESVQRRQAEAVATLLEKVFYDSSPLAQRRPQMDVKSRLLARLDVAAAQLSQEFAAEPLTKARLQHALGITQLGLGEPRKAEALLRAAAQERHARLGQDHADTLAAQYMLMVAYAEAGRRAEALQFLEAIRDRHLAQLGPDDPVTLATQHNLGVLLYETGKRREAQELLTDVYRRRAAQLGPDADSTLSTQHLLALLYREFGRLPEATRMLEQVRDKLLARFGPGHPEVLVSFANLATCYLDAGKWPEAIRLLEQIRDHQAAQLGLDHPYTLTSLHNLAGAYQEAGRVSEAVRLYEQVRDVQSAKLGRQHPATLHTLTSLGLAYQAAGRPKEALQLLEQTWQQQANRAERETDEISALVMGLARVYQHNGRAQEAVPLLERIRDRYLANLGPDHVDTLKALSYLAGAYFKAGRTADAIRLFEQVREQQTRRYGPDHPETLMVLGNLALAYQEAGRLKEALPLFEQVNERSQKVLGPDHPHALAVAANLADAYRDADRFPEAIRLFEQVRDRELVVHGPKHRDTLLTLHNLGLTYQEAKRLPEALRLLEQVLADQMATLGPDHPHTATTQQSLAKVYLDLKRVKEAIQLLEIASQKRTQLLGPDHPHTLMTRANLAAAYWNDRQLDKSVPQYEQVLVAKRKKLGDNHVSTITTAFNLGVNYYMAQKREQAVMIFTEWLPRAEQHLGLNHAMTRFGQQSAVVVFENARLHAQAAAIHRTWANLERHRQPGEPLKLASHLAAAGMDFLYAQQFVEAEPLLRECLTLREKHQPEVWSTFNSKSLLGGALLGQKKYGEAESLLLQGYEGMKAREQTIPPPGKPRLPEALERLIQLYEAQDKPAEVQKWRQELEAVKKRQAAVPGGK
jgi:tetratricopeptide (TPR) repeat protein